MDPVSPLGDSSLTDHPTPAFSAVILSGGRSSRLGGVPKAGLTLDGQSLLDRTCGAVAAAQRVVVVGPTDDQAERDAENARSGNGSGPPREFVREDPPFGGPAAALATAVEHLDDDGAPWLLVLACDMPQIDRAIPDLLAGAVDQPDLSLMAHDGGRDQPLAGLYRAVDLRAAVAELASAGGTQNLSMKALLARVQWRAIDVSPGSTADVDTWADAQSLGVSGTAPI